MELREGGCEDSLWSLLGCFNNEVQDCPLKLDVKTAEPIERFVLISVNSGFSELPFESSKEYGPNQMMPLWQKIRLSIYAGP